MSVPGVSLRDPEEQPSLTKVAQVTRAVSRSLVPLSTAQAWRSKGRTKEAFSGFPSGKYAERQPLRRADGSTPKGERAFEWDVSGACTAPRPLDRTGRTWVDKDLGPTMTARLHVRCRRCEECARYRYMAWRERAMASAEFATRTWFITLTMRPEAHRRFERLCRDWLIARATIPGVRHWRDKMSQLEKYHHLARFEYREVQKYLKRLRRGGARFDFMCVSEMHEGKKKVAVRYGVRHGLNKGRPHFHLLLHERHVNTCVIPSVLQREWGTVSDGLGNAEFDQARDVMATSSYVAKYITKDAGAVVRASLHFGDRDYLEARAVREYGLPGEERPVHTWWPSSLIGETFFPPPPRP